jgi:hypothetical protein
MTNHARMMAYFPEGYEGTIHTNNRDYTICELATRNELPPILFRFGDWAVTTDGLYCLTHDYVIVYQRFHEDWNEHMSEKTWINMDDFSRAYSTAEFLLENDFFRFVPQHQQA